MRIRGDSSIISKDTVKKHKLFFFHIPKGLLAFAVNKLVENRHPGTVFAVIFVAI
jgi:hypothetical protein